MSAGGNLSADGRPAQYGEISTWAIGAGGNIAAAKAFAEHMLTDGYVKWLAISPQGTFPARAQQAIEALKAAL